MTTTTAAGPVRHLDALSKADVAWAEGKDANLGELVDAVVELTGDTTDAPVAVRSRATAEDTEAASFAGMNEPFVRPPPNSDCSWRPLATHPPDVGVLGVPQA